MGKLSVYFTLGLLRHDYLIKYAYFSKWYLERFPSIGAPEKWTTNVVQRKKTRETWLKITQDITSSMTSQNTFSLNGDGLQTLILGIFTTKMLHKRNSVNRKFALYGNDIYPISCLTN